MEATHDIPQVNEELLNRPLFQMTGNDFLALLIAATREKERYANESKQKPEETACGLIELAGKLNCGLSTVNNLRRDGVLDKAIFSSTGNSFIFDVNIARQEIELFHQKKSEMKRKQRLERAHE